MSGLEKFMDIPDEIHLAMVKEVVLGKGVKVQIDGESAPRETYYNSLVIPEVNDRVYFIKTDATNILIKGSLKF